jgi:hypothetical protein
MSELCYEVYERIVRDFAASCFPPPPEKAPVHLQLTTLAAQWAVFLRFLRLVARIFSYLERYHIRHHHLPTVAELGA